MFTGIIEGLGTVKEVVKKGRNVLLAIDTSIDLSETKLGDSIAVNGACLTVTEMKTRVFCADVSVETLDKTNLKTLSPGNRVNLEKALRLNSFLGGHFVLGHVDCVGKIFEKTIQSNSLIFGIEILPDLSKYIVQKGSITVDGISLTINKCDNNRFYVNIIPHTAEKTTLSFKKTGDAVNIETDILGKYLEKLLRPEKKLNMDFLSQHGFLD